MLTGMIATEAVSGRYCGARQRTPPGPTTKEYIRKKSKWIPVFTGMTTFFSE